MLPGAHYRWPPLPEVAIWLASVQQQDKIEQRVIEHILQLACRREENHSRPAMLVLADAGSWSNSDSGQPVDSARHVPQARIDSQRRQILSRAGERNPAAVDQQGPLLVGQDQRRQHLKTHASSIDHVIEQELMSAVVMTVNLPVLIAAFLCAIIAGQAMRGHRRLLLLETGEQSVFFMCAFHLPSSQVEKQQEEYDRRGGWNKPGGLSIVFVGHDILLSRTCQFAGSPKIIMRMLALLILLAIIISLGSALRYLVSDDGKTDRVVRMLTWRIGLSVGLFVLLMIAWYFGLIQPHGIIPD